MSSTVVLFKPHFSATSGWGHISRCQNLFNYLSIDRQFIFFWIGTFPKNIVEHSYNTLDQCLKEQQLKPEDCIVVIDDYNTTTDQRLKLQKAGFTTVFFDDFADQTTVDHLVFNQGKLAEKPENTPNSLFGPLFNLIDPTFSPCEKAHNQLKNENKTKKVLLSFGGTIQTKLITKWLLVVNTVLPNWDIVLLSPISSDKIQVPFSFQLVWGIKKLTLRNLFCQTDLAILPSSNICLEAIKTNTPIATGHFVNNQKLQYKTITQLGCAHELGDFNLPIESCVKSLKSIDLSSHQLQIQQQRKYYNSSSRAMILLRFQLLAQKVQIKTANSTYDDCKFIYDLANDELVRNNSINTQPIPWEQHKLWYHKYLSAGNLFHIYKFESEKFGYVRIEHKKGETIISIAIAPAMRGKKLAPLLIKASSDLFLSSLKLKTPIRAYIWKSNIPSAKSFEKAGYKLSTEVQLANRDFLIFEYGYK